jgi:hypothetical protein
MPRLRPETLNEYVKIARPILVQIARDRSTITYGKLMQRMGGRPGRGYIAEVLEEIAETERAAERPKLTAVVVRSDTGMVGGGFFGLQDTPSNLLRTSPDEWQDSRLSTADRRYWEQELERLYRYWQTH